jgi:hypothetical protein
VEKRFSLGMGAVSLSEDPVVKVLIAGAPNVGEGDVLLGDRGSINHSITITSKERIHVVEVAMPTVDESRVIAFGSEDRTE